LKNFGLIFESKEEKGTFIAPQYLPEELGRNESKLLPDNVMINFLSKYGPFSENLYWKKGICFQNELEQNCIVKLHDNSLEVLAEGGEASYSLQAEICQAFVQLSKNANAEITLDGRRVSWQALEEAIKDGMPKIRDCSGKVVAVSLFERFFEKGTGTFRK